MKNLKIKLSTQIFYTIKKTNKLCIVQLIFFIFSTYMLFDKILKV